MKTIFLKTVGTLLAATWLAGCGAPQQGEALPDPIRAHVDSSFRPQDDFFEYANNTWFKQHPISPTEQSSGIFMVVDDTVQAQVYRICLQAAAAKSDEGSNKQKIGDLFYSGMDSVSLNQKGISELKDELDRIDALKAVNELPAVVARLQLIAGSPLFSFGVGQDEKKSDQYSVGFYQGGLTLPDRRYYVDSDANSVEIRGKFVDYMQGLFRILGYDDERAKASAARVMAFETSIAQTSRKDEDTRDPVKNYNKLS